MEKQLAVAVQTELSQKDIETLVQVGAIPKNAPPDVVRFFGRACAETRLSPFKRQLHLIKRRSNDGEDHYTIQTAIDGYRTIADRTGKYAGNDDYSFSKGEWSGNEAFMVAHEVKQPDTATATVWKIVHGKRCPFVATVRWTEYVPASEKMRFMWNKMPFLMLGKCAEALALRKAFPEETAGIYTEDEMIVESEVDILRPQIEDVPSTGGGGAESSPKRNLQKKTPAAAPIRKFKKREPAAPVNPSELEVDKRLKSMNRTREQFCKAAALYEVVDEGQGWDAMTEEKFLTCLETDNWQMIQDAMNAK